MVSDMVAMVTVLIVMVMVVIGDMCSLVSSGVNLTHGFCHFLQINSWKCAI